MPTPGNPVPPELAAQGYVATPPPMGVSLPGLAEYLRSRGYSADLANSMVSNIEQNQDFPSNQEHIRGAKAYIAARDRVYDPGLQQYITGTTSADDHRVPPGFAAYADSMGLGVAVPRGYETRLPDPEPTVGVDSMASYFQRIGYSADQAMQMASHVLGDSRPGPAEKHPPIPSGIIQPLAHKLDKKLDETITDKYLPGAKAGRAGADGLDTLLSYAVEAKKKNR